MDRFSLHQRNDSFFEDLVWRLCSKLFGIGVSKFAPGKDGGKDARFVGTATLFPSTTGRWSGTIIIQAKHTTKLNASCSDGEFATVMKREKAKIQKMKDDGELTHYICLTNRKRSGVVADRIVKELKKELNLDNLVIEGLETIESWLGSFPNLITELGLDLPAPGLQINPESLEKLILFFDANIDLFAEGTALLSEPPFQFTHLAAKNAINNLSAQYSKDFIEEDSYQYMTSIERFLKHTSNRQWRKRYENVAFRFRQKYFIHRESFGPFEEIFDDILNRLEKRGQVPDSIQLASIFLHYMYVTCDLGLRVPAVNQ